MQNPIRVGDALENGGRVTSGSPDMDFADRFVARKGDSAICDRHGKTTIAEGHPFFTDKGKPIALHHHRCACGCRLISSVENISLA
ncbi:PAAR domain-containing protein [Paraburkholderia fungorum]|uniref:PAAR domain-containing protein n=1 Tax=Paraburkholderia fungorum TaxID=134537 RepID=UPI0038B7B761